MLSDPIDYADFLREFDSGEKGKISEESRRQYALKESIAVLGMDVC